MVASTLTRSTSCCPQLRRPPCLPPRATTFPLLLCFLLLPRAGELGPPLPGGERSGPDFSLD